MTVTQASKHRKSGDGNQMLTEICQYLHNWFNKKPDGTYYPQYDGKFHISDGRITELSDQLAVNQHIRIMGSLFNDGVHKYGDTADALKDEVFNGAVWSMSIPPDFLALADEIAEWQAKYGGIDGTATSPYVSESFGGYSYTKAGGGYSGSSQSVSASWRGIYADRLYPWRKLP